MGGTRIATGECQVYMVCAAAMRLRFFVPLDLAYEFSFFIHDIPDCFNVTSIGETLTHVRLQLLYLSQPTVFRPLTISHAAVLVESTHMGLSSPHRSTIDVGFKIPYETLAILHGVIDNAAVCSQAAMYVSRRRRPDD